jgi:hypothetical protein
LVLCEIRVDVIDEIVSDWSIENEWERGGADGVAFGAVDVDGLADGH